MDGRARNSGGLLEPAAHPRAPSLDFPMREKGVECTPLKNGGLRINSSNLSLRRRRLLYNDGCVGIYTLFIVGVKSESLSSPSHPHAFLSPFLSLPLLPLPCMPSCTRYDFLLAAEAKKKATTSSPSGSRSVLFPCTFVSCDNRFLSINSSFFITFFILTLDVNIASFKLRDIIFFYNISTVLPRSWREFEIKNLSLQFMSIISKLL